MGFRDKHGENKSMFVPNTRDATFCFTRDIQGDFQVSALSTSPLNQFCVTLLVTRDSRHIVNH